MKAESRIIIPKRPALAGLLLLLLVICSCHQDPGEIPVAILPEPASIIQDGRLCEVPNPLSVTLDPSLSSTLDLVAPQFSDYAGIKLVSGKTSEGLGLNLLLDTSINHAEGYSLDITKDFISLRASSEAGIFYGLQSLMQLLAGAKKNENHSSFLGPALHIKDQPRFIWRGMHLDVSRHFFPAEQVKEYIDMLARYKMNVFHWHLTDDQGWRIEIKKYPKLTSVAAWREDRTSFPWSYDMFPAIEGKPVYGGFYTQEEIKDIVDYAARRHITIVPEIEMPGHSWAALYAYPELSCSGKPYFRNPDQPMDFTDPYCAGNEKTFEFLENVIDEIVELFPSPYIHIGGDEAKKEPWEHCAKCRKRMVKEGMKDVQQLQSYFMKRMEKYIISKGRKIIGWDEILEGGLPPEAAVMSWRGEDGGIEAAASGHYAVMAPNSYVYLNYGQSANSALPYEVNTLENVYSYNPAPDELDKEQKEFIMGIQGCLWTEYIQNMKMAEYQLLPRMLAIAETGWTPEEKKDYSRFLKKLPLHFKLLGGKNFYICPPSGLSDHEVFKNSCRIRLENHMGFGEIRYTTDNEEPGKGSKLYKSPITIKENRVIKAVIILPDGRQSSTTTANFVKMKPLEPVEFPPGVTPVAGLDLVIMQGDISSLGQFKTMKPIRYLTAEGIEIPAGVPEDFFGLDFKGFFFAPESGAYAFSARSDDGSRLYLNDSLYINNDGIHGIQQVSCKILLKKGYHPFELQFFDRLRSQSLEVLMGYEHAEEKKIPAEFFFRLPANK
jgi:hexosaminidase